MLSFHPSSCSSYLIPSHTHINATHLWPLPCLIFFVLLSSFFIFFFPHSFLLHSLDVLFIPSSPLSFPPYHCHFLVYLHVTSPESIPTPHTLSFSLLVILFLISPSTSPFTFYSSYIPLPCVLSLLLYRLQRAFWHHRSPVRVFYLMGKVKGMREGALIKENEVMMMVTGGRRGRRRRRRKRR